MRILIVAANQEHKPDPVPPLGAACVASAARRHGHEVLLLDGCFLGESFEAVLSRTLADFLPQVVGLSLRNIDDTAWPQATSYLPLYRRIARTIRCGAPEASLVAGGAAFTLMPQALMADLSPDYGIVSAGEGAFVSLLANLEHSRLPFRGTGPVSERLFRGDAAMPRGLIPAWDLLDAAAYYRRGGALSIQTKRGCAFHCAYCTYPALEGASIFARDPVEAVGEMEHLFRTHGARHFFVVDNTFNIPTACALEFCEALAARKLDIEWSAYVTPRGLTSKVAEAMSRAGCRSVELGTDAATPKTLHGLGKGFSVEEILMACTALREAKIKFSHSLILGGPGETPSTLQNTLNTINDTQPDFVIAMLGVRVYPGTPLATAICGGKPEARASIGLDPVFYVDPAVSRELVPFAEDIRTRLNHWYFPGLEGNRRLSYWRRRRQHGARGPLWALRAQDFLARPQRL